MIKGNRWVSLGAGTAMLLFLGLIYAWSIFKAPFSAIYTEWTVSQISLTFTISMICFCLFGFFAGLIAKKLSVRVILRIAAVMLFCGFFGVSMLDPKEPGKSLVLLYLLYGVLGGGGVGMGYNSIISFVNKSFADKAGIASGTMLMGFGLGGILLGSITDKAISEIGLFMTFRALAVFVAVVILAGSLFMRPSAAPQIQAAKAETEENVRDFTPAQMLKESTFWFFMVWAILLNSASLLVINSAASIAVAFGAPAVLGLVVSLFNGAGRVIHGAVFDRVREKKTMLLDNSFVLLAGIFLYAGAVTKSMILVLLGLVCTGLGYGGTPTLSSAFIHSKFGPKNFAVNFSIGNFALIPAAILGPMASSALIERAGGAYNTTFMMMLGLAVLGGVMWAILSRK